MITKSLDIFDFCKPIYLRSGQAGILLIHGFSSTPGQLQPIAKKLHEEGFTVSVPLLAGHGSTPDELEKTNARDWYRSTELAFIDLKKDVKKVIVIGASFGGNLAFHLNKSYSNDISGLISIMTPIHFYHERSLYFITRVVAKFIKSIRKKGSSGVPIYPTSQFNDVGSYISLPLKSLLDFYKFIRKHKNADLKSIIQPLRIIQTNNDSVIKPTSAQTIYKAANSKEKKIIWIDSKCHTVPWPESSQLFDKFYPEIKVFIDSCF